MCKGHITQMLAIYNISAFTERNISTEKSTPPSNLTHDITVCCLQCLKKKGQEHNSSYPAA